MKHEFNRDRRELNKYKKLIYTHRYIQIDFHDHFLSEGHNGLIDDVEIVFIDKTDPSDPTRREEFWRNKLKTLAPYGLNVEE